MPPSTPSDPSRLGHVPGVGGRSGCHMIRLRQRSLDRPSCLPATASAVGLERRRAAAFRLTTLRPCVRRTDQPTLALRSASSLKWPGLRTIVPWSVRLCGRLTESTSSPLRHTSRFIAATVQSVLRWRQSLSCCWFPGLEQSATGGRISAITGHLSQASVHRVIFEHNCKVHY